MSIHLPPPFVSEYMVAELYTMIPRGKSHPRLVPNVTYDGRGNPNGLRPVNTIDIVNEWAKPGVFITNWHEIHYEIYYDNTGAPRQKEVVVTRHHNENQARINRIRQAWEAYYQNPDAPITAPEMLSLEQELARLGWQFKFVAGDPEGNGGGPMYPPNYEQQVNWALPGEQVTPQQVHANQQAYGQAQAPQQPPAPAQVYQQAYQPSPTQQPPPQDGALNRLELKMDELNQNMVQIAQVLLDNIQALTQQRNQPFENNDRFATPQPHAPGVPPQNGQQYFQHASTGPAAPYGY